MRKSSLSKRIQASVVSMVLAASAAVGTFSVTAGAAFTPDISVSTEKTAVDTLTEGEKFLGYTADYASSGIKTITIAITPNYTGNFSYGFGFGVSAAPDWYELNGKTGEFVAGDGSGTSIPVKAGQTTNIVFDLSDYDLSYKPSSDKYPGKFEFRAYYCGEAANGSISIDSIKVNDTSTPTNPTDPKEDPKDPSSNAPHDNKKSGSWSFKVNPDGKTATVSSTLSKQIDNLGLTLTAHMDEDYYAKNPDELVEGAPTNAYKVPYAAFGLADFEGVTIESLTATISVDDSIPVKSFMYGGGLNVAYGSDADTEYYKVKGGDKETGGYWYNDMGADELAALKSEFPIPPRDGVTIENPGNYFDCYWEVPSKVQPFVDLTGTGKAISFQFWYAEEDAEEWTELTECTLERVSLTYTKEVVVPYSGSKTTAIGETMELGGTDNSIEKPYSELGVPEDNFVQAVKFKVSSDTDLKKIVFMPATSVTKDALGYDYWYMEDEQYPYCIIDINGKSAEIMYIMPQYIRGTDLLANLVDSAGKLNFGYWYGEDTEGNEVSTLTLDDVQVYYSEFQLKDIVNTTTTVTTTSTKPVTTTTTKATTTTTKVTTTTTKKVTTTTTATTTKPVTTTTTVPPTSKPLEVTLWGDADCNGVVEINDAVRVMSYVSSKASYPISAQGLLNADVYMNGDGVSNMDALSIQKLIADVLIELPESYLK